MKANASRLSKQIGLQIFKSLLWIIIRHKCNHIGNVTIQRFANLDKGGHGDMLPLAHVGDMVRCQMRLEPQIFLAHVLVNQCFPQRFIADFHSLFHLSGLGPAGAAPALWPFDYYTASIEKTQCTVAILLQKLRHTQRICLYINLGIKCFMPWLFAHVR